MRCPNCGEEIWGEGGVCDYCGASLRAQPGQPSRPSSNGGAKGARPQAAQAERGGWKQVPAAGSPSPIRGARARAQERAKERAQDNQERRPSTLGDLFGRSGPPRPDQRSDQRSDQRPDQRPDQRSDRGGGPAMPRFAPQAGPQAAPPTPRRAAQMASQPASQPDGKWRVSPDADVAAAPPTRRGFAEPDPPPESPPSQSRSRWSAGPLQQFRQQVRADLDDEDVQRPRRPPVRSSPVDTARRIGRKLGLGRADRDDRDDRDDYASDGPARSQPDDWDGPPRRPQHSARRGPPTPRAPDFAQPWQAPAPGAGWDFGPAQQPSQQPYNGGPYAPDPHSPAAHPLGGTWPGAATDLPMQQNAIPDEVEPDYHDTGRGWSIAMPYMQEAPPAFSGHMTGGPRPPRAPRTPRMTGGAMLGEVSVGEVAAALVARLGRYTFNLILIGIILIILAIPVSIGLAHFAASQQTNPAVAAAKTPRPVPTPYSGYVSYKTGLFSISYPKTWTQSAASRDVSPGGTDHETDFTSPDKTMLFTVGTLTAVPNDQSQFTLEAITPTFPSSAAANYTPTKAPSAGQTVDGQPAIEIDFTCDYLLPSQKVVTLQATALLRTEGLTTFVVIYAAPRSQFGTVEGQTFNPMLASLRLTG